MLMESKCIFCQDVSEKVRNLTINKENKMSRLQTHTNNTLIYICVWGLFWD